MKLNVYNNISQNNVWFIYGGCWMWPWCVMMVLKVVTGRGKRTLKIYSPERPFRCWHICTSCNALQGVFRFFCAFIFPSPVMRIVDGLSWSWPYRSGNILTVGGLRNLKQILAGFQISAASWPPPRPPALSGHIAPRPLSSTSHHPTPPPTFCGEIQKPVQCPGCIGCATHWCQQWETADSASDVSPVKWMISAHCFLSYTFSLFCIKTFDSPKPSSPTRSYKDLANCALSKYFQLMRTAAGEWWWMQA